MSETHETAAPRLSIVQIYFDGHTGQGKTGRDRPGVGHLAPCERRLDRLRLFRPMVNGLVLTAAASVGVLAMTFLPDPLTHAQKNAAGAAWPR